MKYLCLLLPFPPTINGLYAGGTRGRFKNKKYVAWEREAFHAIRSQKLVYFEKPVGITLSYGRPDKRVRDLLNYSKAPMDFLVKAHVLADDSLIERAVEQWSEAVVGCQIEISER